MLKIGKQGSWQGIHNACIDIYKKENKEESGIPISKILKMNEMKHAINGLIPEAQYRLTIMLSGYKAKHYSNIGVYYYLLKLISFFLSTFIKLLQFNV